MKPDEAQAVLSAVGAVSALCATTQSHTSDGTSKKYIVQICDRRLGGDRRASHCRMCVGELDRGASGWTPRHALGHDSWSTALGAVVHSMDQMKLVSTQ